MMGAYDMEITYVEGRQNEVADSMSRIPCCETPAGCDRINANVNNITTGISYDIVDSQMPDNDLTEARSLLEGGRIPGKEDKSGRQA